MGLPRILLADDHHEMLEKVVYLLQGEFEILAAVGNGKRLIEAALRLDPDLIVTDISMPVLGGIEAIRSLKKSASRAKVIFLTVHEDPAFVAVALSVGAQGYVLKNRIFVDLIPAIRKVLQGHVFASQPVSMQ
jgi:DNA-binding NarL/FixJ family response regulator